MIESFLAEHPAFRIDDPRKYLPASAEELVDAKWSELVDPSGHSDQILLVVHYKSRDSKKPE